MQEITISDKTFERFISEKQIAQRVAELGQLISEDYKDKNPLFLVLLKGAYVFASDLVKHFLHPCSISFFRLSSYKGMASSGVLSFKDVFDEDIEGRNIVVLEDIVDTGHTLSGFLPALNKLNPKSVKVVSLLSKPDVLQGKVEIDYLGFEIPPAFVVGYGLDFDEQGRNFPEIYQLKK
ncbi:MAG: hypoxanthine phosphoribosyltransferase [Saprospiraceae bacterium]|nr:hypoxanthine phosphoribosyltransferase [Saprospiraceae bacterium]